jgi:hypothetical protein
MAKQTILNKNYEIKDGMATITETVESILSKEELQNQKAQYIQKQAQLTNQISALQIQYKACSAAIDDIDKIIIEIDSQEEKED